MDVADRFVTFREYDARHREIMALVHADIQRGQQTAQDIAELRGWVKGAVTGVGLLAAVATAIPFLLR
jgi:hypothetical protein